MSHPSPTSTILEENPEENSGGKQQRAKSAKFFHGVSEFSIRHCKSKTSSSNKGYIMELRTRVREVLAHVSMMLIPWHHQASMLLMSWECYAKHMSVYC